MQSMNFMRSRIESNDKLRVEIEGAAELLTEQTILHTCSLFKRPGELGCTAAMREETRLAADMAEKSYTSVSLFEHPKLVDSMPEAEDLEREWLPEVVDAEGNPYHAANRMNRQRRSQSWRRKRASVKKNCWLCYPMAGWLKCRKTVGFVNQAFVRWDWIRNCK